MDQTDPKPDDQSASRSVVLGAGTGQDPAGSGGDVDDLAGTGADVEGLLVELVALVLIGLAAVTVGRRRAIVRRR